MVPVEVSDILAQLVYPATFIVCMTWVGISIANMLNGHWVRHAMLAMSMLFAAVAFGLLSFSAGRQVFTLSAILLYFRVAMTGATIFGAGFTVLYLWGIWKKTKRTR